jgi:hypothetical protein
MLKLKRFETASDEIVLAEALVYFVFIGAIALIATFVAHAI